MMMLKGCVCGGDQYADWDELAHEWALACLQCGRRPPVPPKLALVALPQKPPFVLAGPRRGLRAV